MNRFASKLSWAAVLLSGLLCLNSCGDDNDDGGSGDGSSPDSVLPLSPAEQKAYMETVAREFMDLTPASDFKDITTLGRYVTDTYFDGYDWSEAEKWGKDIIDGLKQYVGMVRITTTIISQRLPAIRRWFRLPTSRVTLLPPMDAGYYQRLMICSLSSMINMETSVCLSWKPVAV